MDRGYNGATAVAIPVIAEIFELDALSAQLLGHVHDIELRIQPCDRQQKGQHTLASPITKHGHRHPRRLSPSDKARATSDRISIVADYLDAAKVKAQPVFDTHGRGEMLAGERTAGIAVMRLSGLALPMGTKV